MRIAANGPFASEPNVTDSALTISAQSNNETLSEWLLPVAVHETDSNTINLEMNFDSSELNRTANLTFTVTTTATRSILLRMTFDFLAIDKNVGAICAGTILVLLNALIISEVGGSARLFRRGN